ncbi:MAG: PIN domain-containing protein [Chitinophagaceae bacterium]
MNPRSGLIVILDANVLYPASVRSFLLFIASEGLFEPKWTDAIHEEWIKNLLEKRKDITRANLEIVKSAMNAAFPDSTISGYEHLIQDLDLPDPNDRHVVAAARTSGVNLIVTNNKKDFPVKILNAYNLKVCSPFPTINCTSRINILA